MTPRLSSLLVAGLLMGAAPAHAACGWFGTQLECDVGAASDVVIGTQIADEPFLATSTFRPSPCRAATGCATTAASRPSPSAWSSRTSGRTRVSAGGSGTRATATEAHRRRRDARRLIVT